MAMIFPLKIDLLCPCLTTQSNLNFMKISLFFSRKKPVYPQVYDALGQSNTMLWLTIHYFITFFSIFLLFYGFLTNLQPVEIYWKVISMTWNDTVNNLKEKKTDIVQMQTVIEYSWRNIADRNLRLVIEIYFKF